MRLCLGKRPQDGTGRKSLAYCIATCNGDVAAQHQANRHSYDDGIRPAGRWREFGRGLPLHGDCDGKGAMKARIRWIEGVSFAAETGSGHALVVDGSPEAGGRNLGPRPMELVLAGAAACTAFDVVWILNKARQPVADCVVEAEADRAETEPRVFTTIRLNYRVAGRGLDPRQVERAVQLSKEKYCSATIMLARTAEVRASVEIVEGDRVPRPG